MIKKFSTFVFVVIFIFSSAFLTSVYAQAGQSGDLVSASVSPSVSDNTLNKRKLILPTKVQAREERKEAIKEQKKDNIEERKDFKEMILQKRQEASEQAKIKREEFKEKLYGIKDEKKQQIVSNMNEKLSTLNQNQTTTMVNVLDKLESILEKIIVKTEEVQGRGVDTTLVNADIELAKIAISDAKNSVTTQVGKEYVFEISSETGLKNVVGQTVSTFKTDINATRKEVMLAKQAVFKASQTLIRMIKAYDANKTGTSSGKVSK